MINKDLKIKVLSNSMIMQDKILQKYKILKIDEEI